MKRMMIIVLTLLLIAGLAAQERRMVGEQKHENEAMQGKAMRHQEMHGTSDGCDRMKGEDCNGGDCGMMKGKKQMHPDKKHDAMMLTKHLNLTDAQQAQYKELHYQARLDKIQLKADIEALKLKRDHALKNAEFSDAKKLNKALYEKKAALAAIDMELKMKLYNLLDDTQRELWISAGQKGRGK